jgi:MFS family permease
MSIPLPEQPAGPALPGQLTPSPAEESPWRVGTLSYTRAGLIKLSSWLLWGDLAWSIRDRSIITVLQLLLKKFQASDATAGLLTGAFPAAIGLILSPMIGYCSDHYRSRWGRRLPFLLVSAPVAGMAIIGLGFSPYLGKSLHVALGAHSPGLFPSVLIVLALWWILFDCATAITNSIFTALINDVVPHGVIGRFYGLFRGVSLLAGVVFNYALLEKAEQYYEWMFVTVGAIYGIGIVWMCCEVREGEYPPPPPVEQGSAVKRFFLASRDYLGACFTKPFYLWFFAASNLGIVALAPVNLYSVFFAKGLGVGTGLFGKYLAYTFFISFCLTYPLGMLTDRFHPLRLSMVVIVLYGLVTLWGGFFALTPLSFGAAFLAHGVLSGSYYTVSASLGQRLLPQTSFAQYTSASGMVGAILNIIIPPMMGYWLDLSNHNYRLTFLASSMLSFVAFGCLTVVYCYWRRLGGPHHFVAPK